MGECPAAAAPLVLLEGGGWVEVLRGLGAEGITVLVYGEPGASCSTALPQTPAGAAAGNESVPHGAWGAPGLWSQGPVGCLCVFSGTGLTWRKALLATSPGGEISLLRDLQNAVSLYTVDGDVAAHISPC